MSPELQRLIEAERERAGDAPAPEADATWRRLKRSVMAGSAAPFDLPPAAVKLSTTGKVLTVLGSKAGKIGLVAALASGSATAVVVSSSERGPDEPVVSASNARSDRDDRRAEPTRARREAPQAVVELEAVEPEPEPAKPEPEPEKLEPDPEPTEGETSRRPTPRRRSQASSPTPPEPAPFEAEFAIIEQAQAALRAGRAQDALRHLDRHRTEHPRGALVEDREALRVVALCRLQRDDDAGKARDEFLKRWPRSLHVKRVTQACNAD